MKPDRRIFRAHDVVRHTPTGEEWLLATDEENGHVFPAGWPCTLARSSDCELLTPATPEKRFGMLLAWVNQSPSYESERDTRTHIGRRQFNTDKEKATNFPECDDPFLIPFKDMLNPAVFHIPIVNRSWPSIEDFNRITSASQS